MNVRAEATGFSPRNGRSRTINLSVPNAANGQSDDTLMAADVGPSGTAMFRRATSLSRIAGPSAIVGLAASWACVWFALRPSGQPLLSYFGQLMGAETVLLLSISLVLISTMPQVEIWFDGIDHAAIWHRRAAITGVILIIPHILIAANPDPSSAGPLLAVVSASGLLLLVIWAILPRWRSVIPAVFRPAFTIASRVPGVRYLRVLLGGYERWRAFHRLTGLFLAAGFLHGVLDGTPFAKAPALRMIYISIGVIGLVFYGYRELLARRFVSLHDYQVKSVEAVGDGMLELALAPLGAPLRFVPGQFAMLFLESASGWRRHPFSMTSAPSAETLRFAVKALGDDTTHMQTEIRPGMPAIIRGPFGRFSHAKGGEHQLWLAGGIGITPFLSWLRALDENPAPGTIDFFYSSSDVNPPFAEELEAIAARHEELRVHVAQGRLTAASVLGAVRAAPPQLSVFLCGPEQMVRSFQADLRRAGVPPAAIHREYFTWR